MKDRNDTSTIDALARGPGRPAKYGSAAEKQRAYRERKNANTVDYASVCSKARQVIIGCMERYHEATDDIGKIINDNAATGALMLWRRLAFRIDAEKASHDEAVFEEIIKYWKEEKS
jgi:hypothetical protein